MRLLLLLLIGAIAVAASKNRKEFNFESFAEVPQSERSILVNILVRQLLNYIRYIINNGSTLFGVPPLDPLVLDHFHLTIPRQLVNAELDVKGAFITGFGGFVVHKSNLQLSDLSFEIDISVPKVDLSAEQYELNGDIFNAIPIYGHGRAAFQVEGFRFQATIFLKQSDDKKSVLIDRVENVDFQMPILQSQLEGVIGGGDIDNIMNAVVEEVMLDYINRFSTPIAKIASQGAVTLLNPILDQLDTWQYLEILL